jgi:hypothetical protein
MLRTLRIFSTLSLALCLWLDASVAGATNYTLWINGRSTSGGLVAGTYGEFKYWGPATASAGVNKKAVNWDGKNSIATTNGAVLNALDCYCTGNNWCYIAVHSAGDLQIGYALSLYGGSPRYKKDAIPNTAGACGNSDGKTQTGWNIKWVAAASGAGGGSELADLGTWLSSDPLTKDLVTTTARAKYNHNQTYGRTVYRFAGAAGALYSAVLPGQDDQAVAYHSSGGVSGASGASFGNPSDWFSNDLTMGTAACEGGATKWSYHTVYLRDDAQSYDHFAAGNWLGIVGPVRDFVSRNAL